MIIQSMVLADQTPVKSMPAIMPLSTSKRRTRNWQSQNSMRARSSVKRLEKDTSTDAYGQYQYVKQNPVQMNLSVENGYCKFPHINEKTQAQIKGALSKAANLKSYNFNSYDTYDAFLKNAVRENSQFDIPVQQQKTQQTYEGQQYSLDVVIGQQSQRQSPDLMKKSFDNQTRVIKDSNKKSQSSLEKFFGKLSQARKTQYSQVRNSKSPERSRIQLVQQPGKVYAYVRYQNEDPSQTYRLEEAVPSVYKKPNQEEKMELDKQIRKYQLANLYKLKNLKNLNARNLQQKLNTQQPTQNHLRQQWLRSQKGRELQKSSYHQSRISDDSKVLTLQKNDTSSTIQIPTAITDKDHTVRPQSEIKGRTLKDYVRKQYMRKQVYANNASSETESVKNSVEDYKDELPSYDNDQYSQKQLDLSQQYHMSRVQKKVDHNMNLAALKLEQAFNLDYPVDADFQQFSDMVTPIEDQNHQFNIPNPILTIPAYQDQGDNIQQNF